MDEWFGWLLGKVSFLPFYNVGPYIGISDDVDAKTVSVHLPGREAQIDGVSMGERLRP